MLFFSPVSNLYLISRSGKNDYYKVERFFYRAVTAIRSAVGEWRRWSVGRKTDRTQQQRNAAAVAANPLPASCESAGLRSGIGVVEMAGHNFTRNTGGHNLHPLQSEVA